MKSLSLFFLLLSGWMAGLMAAPLKIVATFLPMYAHTKSITGEFAEVTQLLDGQSEPHEFQFKPSDVRKIAQADLLIVSGMGLENWAQGLIKQAANTHLVVVDTSVGIAALANPQEIKLTQSSGPQEEGVNPHIWLDPVLAQQQVKTILRALVKADPGHAAEFTKNAEIYLQKLVQLDQDYQDQLEKLPSKNLLTFHDAFPYLAARYHLNYLGSIEEFPEKEPSPRQLACVIDTIKKNQVRVLFAEEGYEPKLLQTIAAQTGAVVSSMDTLEVGQPAVDAYLVRMRANLGALRQAWIK